MRTRLLTLLLLITGCMGFAQNRYSGEKYFTFNPYDYSSNMPCRFEIYVNGEIANSAEYEIGAFVGDEIRASDGLQPAGTWGYTNAFWNVQIYGMGIQEDFTFKIYDHATNTLLEVVSSVVPWNNDGYGLTAATVARIDFYTPVTCTFTNVDGNNWSTEANWSPRIPASCDDAVIAANSICVIDEDATVAYKTLTIKDGAQFVGDGEEYEVTFEKEIAAYTPGTRNNYYFIANPTDGEFLETENLLEGNFDLYFFNQVGVDDQNAEEPEIKEWQNYKTYIEDLETWGDFVAKFGGYLYANAVTTTLKFTGIANGTDDVTIGAITYESDAEDGFAGFNLIGNPLTCNASVVPYQSTTNITGFYTLNSNGSEVVSKENPVVAPCSAIFAVTTKTSTANRKKIKFTANIDGTVNTRNITSLINIEVNNNSGLQDRAYVRFNEQENLQKFTLNPNAPHIFFREEGKDYAIVQGNERMSQLPLFFETREYGTYTINVKLENLTCEYLHLIDNLTGMDVDLLATPSYTFQANSSDYAARFKIVFEGTGVEENTANESFAIVEGNRVIIPAIEHESTLEVIDMTGRTVSSQKVNGSFDQTLNVKAGIYMLRLNGMTQKIVVE